MLALEFVCVNDRNSAPMFSCQSFITYALPCIPTDAEEANRIALCGLRIRDRLYGRVG